MEKVLVLKMLNSEAVKRRKSTECRILFAEELGFRELIILDECLQWNSYIEQSRVELNYHKLRLKEQQMLDDIHSQVISSFDLGDLHNEEMQLRSSILNFQNRLNEGEEWFKSFDSNPTKAEEKRIEAWNHEKETLEVHMAHLRIRIANLNEEPTAKAPPNVDNHIEVYSAPLFSETISKDIQISKLAEWTKESLDRARNLLT
ncbi:uncharacterized protein TM35_000022210 [Trypanosoma theileri]|uniref:Uncharacterized protein n=1 Tax=Trypanosoma theileri TaxID=67003 RepID=A0A1X0P7S5_9TRYP|nr:uncharacterized protein TM35_000022210 [Trypanosoma theileri]ORC92895.1 hypothetical protein TM35_000022210 [Trypanosoma theileri]